MPALKDYLSREKTTLRAIDMGVVTFLAWVDFFVNENENDASILKSGGTVSRRSARKDGVLQASGSA